MKNKCKSCNRLMTWAAVRSQFKRLVNRGFTSKEAGEILPRCSKCLTTYLKNYPRVETVETYLT